jgi:hypothetical protein
VSPVVDRLIELRRHLEHCARSGPAVRRLEAR